MQNPPNATDAERDFYPVWLTPTQVARLLTRFGGTPSGDVDRDAEAVAGVIALLPPPHWPHPVALPVPVPAAAAAPVAASIASVFPAAGLTGEQELAQWDAARRAALAPVPPLPPEPWPYPVPLPVAASAAPVAGLTGEQELAQWDAERRAAEAQRRAAASNRGRPPTADAPPAAAYPPPSPPPPQPQPRPRRKEPAMMTLLLNAAAAALDARRAADLAAYRELLARADAPAEGDGAALAALLPRLNLTMEEADADANATMQYVAAERRRPTPERMAELDATRREAGAAGERELAPLSEELDAAVKALVHPGDAGAAGAAPVAQRQERAAAAQDALELAGRRHARKVDAAAGAYRAAYDAMVAANAEMMKLARAFPRAFGE